MQHYPLEYRPQFPDRFGSLEDARLFCKTFFDWYNLEHHHSSIAYLTPHQVHTGLAQAVLDQRQQTLNRAFTIAPERFVRQAPQAPKHPGPVWINPPVSPKDAAKETP